MIYSHIIPVCTNLYKYSGTGTSDGIPVPGTGTGRQTSPTYSYSYQYTGTTGMTALTGRYLDQYDRSPILCRIST